MPELNDATVKVLRKMHKDPFVQEATWRLYAQAPGLLDSAVYVALAYAQDVTPQQMLETMTKNPRHKIGA